jgi:hypothetical protein
MTDTMTGQAKLAFDDSKFNEFLGKMLGDVGAAIGGALVVLGDRLGFYRALAERGPMTSIELAAQTGTHERYVREWLANQAAISRTMPQAKSSRFPPNTRRCSRTKAAP